MKIGQLIVNTLLRREFVDWVEEVTSKILL